MNQLTHFVRRTTKIVDQTSEDHALTEAIRPLLAELVITDDWLPDSCAIPHEHYYQQYLLHCDPLERFSVVSFVWGPGQSTPIHDHTVWGLIGMLRGSEVSTPFYSADDRLTAGDPVTLKPGQVEILLPDEGDIHQVRNAHDDKVSVSIHVYGGNIGRIYRHTFDTDTGQQKSFVSGFSSTMIPNIWG